MAIFGKIGTTLKKHRTAKKYEKSRTVPFKTVSLVSLLLKEKFLGNVKLACLVTFGCSCAWLVDFVFASCGLENLLKVELQRKTYT